MKPVTRTIVIISAVLAAILIAVLTLCLVKQTPLYTAVDGYVSVDVYEAQSTDRFADLTDKDGTKLNYSAALKNSGYSVMQGILEGKPGKKLVFKKDSSGKAVTTAVDQIEAITAPEGSYMLEFCYGEEKTVAVEGEEIKYDRARVIFADSKNEIGDVEIVFYITSAIGNEEQDDYEAKTVIARARTTALYAFVKDGIAAMN